MTARNPRNGSATPWLMVGLVVLVAVGAIWMMLGRSPSSPEGTKSESALSRDALDRAAPAARQEASTSANGVRAPSTRIADQGRLSVTRESLREGDVLALGLELPDVLRGAGPREAMIIGVDGRTLELRALPVDGADGGLRLEIDPEWLEPGRYMIQVETEGGEPLRVRRYVLEVE